MEQHNEEISTETVSKIENNSELRRAIMYMEHTSHMVHMLLTSENWSIDDPQSRYHAEKSLLISEALAKNAKAFVEAN